MTHEQVLKTHQRHVLPAKRLEMRLWNTRLGMDFVILEIDLEGSAQIKY